MASHSDRAASFLLSFLVLSDKPCQSGCRLNPQTKQPTRKYGCNTIRPALSGGMDWWCMEWLFSRVRKIFFRGRNSQEYPCNSAERAILTKFQAPKFEISEPDKMQFHTPNHSIPPLDSLLNMASSMHYWAPYIKLKNFSSLTLICTSLLLPSPDSE